MSVLRLAIIVGSTRDGRFCPTAAHWFAQQARSHSDFEIDVVDLADVQLPAVMTDFGAPEPAEVTALAPRLEQADAFVVVTPEYNHSYPASLKVAIDWYRDEWQAKPVGFVSYGGMGGGLRAVEHLRTVFAEVHAMTVRDTISFHAFWEKFDEDGQPHDGESCARAAKGMLDQLSWWAGALKEARARETYCG